MVPFDWPGQPSLLASDRATAVGWVSVLDWLVVQPSASCRLTVWDPEARAAKVCGDVKVLYPPPSIWTCRVPVPPEKVAVTVPVGTPLHVRSVLVSDSDSAGGAVSETDWDTALPSASPTVTVCVP